MTTYDPNTRVAECPDDDACELARIEIEFGCRVHLTQERQHQLIELIEAIVREPWNQPANGVHWVCGVGSRPMWSKIDALMLGKQPDPRAPESGEPTFDHSVLHVESHARGFLPGEERDR